MEIRYDPLKQGFYWVDDVLDGKDEVSVYFEIESAQSAVASYIRRGIECKGMRHWKPKLEIMSIKKKWKK